MKRISVITCEAEISDLLGSLSGGEKTALAEQLIDECLAANCAGFDAASTSSYLETIGLERATIGVNAPAAEARCIGVFAVLARIFPEGSEENTSNKSLLAHLRYLLLWQLLLIESDAQIRRRIENVHSLISSIFSLSTKDRVRVQLQMYHLWMRYYEYEKANEALTIALVYSGVEIELIKMGDYLKKFREPQFELDMTISLEYGALSPEEEDCDEESDVPAIVVPDQDNVLTKKIHSKDDECSGPPPPLTSLHLALLLAAADHECKKESNAELRLLKGDAYIDQILLRRRCWPVQTAALALRSQLEVADRQRVDRAFRQMETLVQMQMGGKDGMVDAHLLDRAHLALASGLCPFWRTKERLERMRNNRRTIPPADLEVGLDEEFL